MKTFPQPLSAAEESDCIYALQNGNEKEAAEKLINKLESDSGKKVFIAIEQFKAFYTAEEEHQDYYLKHPEEFEKELIESGRK